MSRVGTGLIWAGVVVLAALMAYTLALDVGGMSPWNRGNGPAGTSQVAVVFPAGRGGRVEQHGPDRGAGRGAADVGGAGGESWAGPAHPLGDLGPRRAPGGGRRAGRAARYRSRPDLPLLPEQPAPGRHGRP